MNLDVAASLGFVLSLLRLESLLPMIRVCIGPAGTTPPAPKVDKLVLRR